MSIDPIQPYLITYIISVNSRRALTLLFTHSPKLGDSIKVALWHQNVLNLMACKVCEEGLVVEDEYDLFFTCSTYIVKAMVTY